MCINPCYLESLWNPAIISSLNVEVWARNGDIDPRLLLQALITSSPEHNSFPCTRLQIINPVWGNMCLPTLSLQWAANPGACCMSLQPSTTFPGCTYILHQSGTVRGGWSLYQVVTCWWLTIFYLLPEFKQRKGRLHNTFKKGNTNVPL